MSTDSAQTTDTVAKAEGGGFTVGQAILLCLILSFFVTGTLLAFQGRRADRDYAKAVLAASTDPTLTAEAAKAGYRLEIGSSGLLPIFGTVWLEARCVRANEAGPLPCDAAPRPAGRVGETMEVIPPDAGAVARKR